MVRKNEQNNKDRFGKRRPTLVAAITTFETEVMSPSNCWIRKTRREAATQPGAWSEVSTTYLPTYLPTYLFTYLKRIQFQHIKTTTRQTIHKRKYDANLQRYRGVFLVPQRGRRLQAAAWLTRNPGEGCVFPPFHHYYRLFFRLTFSQQERAVVVAGEVYCRFYDDSGTQCPNVCRSPRFNAYLTYPGSNTPQKKKWSERTLKTHLRTAHGLNIADRVHNSQKFWVDQSIGGKSSLKI